MYGQSGAYRGKIIRRVRLASVAARCRLDARVARRTSGSICTEFERGTVGGGKGRFANVPLDFDSSRAPLSPHDFAMLVRAVLEARGSDETSWIEWKSSLDLGSPEGKTAIARGIVGLANRLPEVANAHCEGRSYLLVGVQPGDLIGADEVDPTVLESRLRSYLGDDGPRWAPHWVAIDGRTVLVIEVAAPRAGDPVHHIRREGPGGVRDGDIFVRRGAATVRPSSVELQGLLNRATTTSALHGLRFTLIAPEELPLIDFSSSAVDRWLIEERNARLASLQAQIAPESPLEVGHPRSLGDLTPASRKSSKSGISFFELKELADRQGAGEHLSADEQARLETGMQSLRPGIAALAAAASKMLEWQPEKRTAPQYETEVEEYLDRCRERLPRVLRLSAGERLPPARFAICNDTDENYPQVSVLLHVPGAIEAAPVQKRASNEGRLPLPPLPYGSRRASPLGPLLGDYARLRPAMVIPKAGPTRQPGLSVSIEHGGSVTLTFSPIDVRPQQQRVLLAPVVLLPQIPIESPVIATWEATSSGVRGVARGTVSLTLGTKPWSISEAIVESGDA
jgi:hypothetical protein